VLSDVSHVSQLALQKIPLISGEKVRKAFVVRSMSEKSWAPSKLSTVQRGTFKQSASWPSVQPETGGHLQ
jgi:hypothetical protein